MTQDKKPMSLAKAAGCYLATIESTGAGMERQVINQFTRWFGHQRLIDNIMAEEIANYAQRMSSSDVENRKKLDTIRAFLTYVKKSGWTKKNMAVHLRAKKSKAKSTAAGNQAPRQVVPLTQQGYETMERELKDFKGKRPQIVEEISKAAADKDFRENAPLHAAKERLGHLEGRIMELEETLKSAVISGDRADVIHRVCTGDSVVLLDLSRNEELSYKIVNPREVAPAKGRISNASPIGKAIIGRECGDVIEIEAPVGKLRYRLEKVGR
ncbi:GreA/GreB family elongation factor [Chloroflexota bacterium]